MVRGPAQHRNDGIASLGATSGDTSSMGGLTTCQESNRWTLRRLLKQDSLSYDVLSRGRCIAIGKAPKTVTVQAQLLRESWSYCT